MTISPIKLWRNQKYIRQSIGKVGTIVSYTHIRVPPSGFEDQAPYIVVLVKIGEHTKIGQLVDCTITDVQIGLSVQAILRRVRKPDDEGVIPYGIKFKLV